MDAQIDQLTCRRCKETLLQDATLCSHCGSEQSRKLSFVKGSAKATGVIIAIVMMIVALVQLKMAFQEKADASAAVKEVRALADITSNRAKSIQRFQSALLSGEETMFFIFLRGPGHKLLPLNQALSRIGSDHGDAYQRAFWLEMSLQKVDSPSIQVLREMPDTYYFSLFEVIILSWLHERYYAHWVRENEAHHRFAFSQSGGANFPTSSYPYLLKWSKKDIEDDFSDNLLFAHAPPSWGDCTPAEDVRIRDIIQAEAREICYIYEPSAQHVGHRSTHERIPS